MDWVATVCPEVERSMSGSITSARRSPGAPWYFASSASVRLATAASNDCAVLGGAGVAPAADSAAPVDAGAFGPAQAVSAANPNTSTARVRCLARRARPQLIEAAGPGREADA